MSIKERKLQDGSSVWDVTIDAGRHPLTGKRVQSRKTLKNKTEAKRYEREELRKRDRGEQHARTRQTLEAYLHSWLSNVVDVTLEPTTQAQYRWAVEKRIIPALGHVALADLSTTRIQQWIADLSRGTNSKGAHIGHRSIEESYSLLRRALNLAVIQRLLPHNPALGVVLPKRERHAPLRAWSPEQAARFLEVAQQDHFEPFWTLALMTGMRRGELLALRWADVDFTVPCLTVRGSRPMAGSKPIDKQPKTPKSHRTIPLSPAFAQYLQDWHTAQLAHIEECLDLYTDNDLICCTPLGMPWYPTSLTRHFTDLVTLAGVPKINLHGTRRTYASVALRGGQSLAAVSEVLGHADRATTLRVYQDIHEDQRQAVANAVEDAYMSHFKVDVTCDVTCDDGQQKSDTEKGIAPEESEVRPRRLERRTFRSATRTPISSRLLQRIEQARRAASAGEPFPLETDGQSVG